MRSENDKLEAIYCQKKDLLSICKGSLLVYFLQGSEKSCGAKLFLSNIFM